MAAENMPCEDLAAAVGGERVEDIRHIDRHRPHALVRCVRQRQMLQVAAASEQADRLTKLRGGGAQERRAPAEGVAEAHIELSECLRA